MPSEISHVVYAARLLTNLGDSVKEPSYWLGTVFPNIRHLNVVSRYPLHVDKVTLYSLVSNTDFVTGMRVHAWIDATSVHFYHSYNAQELLPYHPLLKPALRITEDKLLYDYFPDWNLIHRLLNTVHEFETNLVDEEKFIKQWHTMLQNYFSHQPNKDSITDWLVREGATKHSANEIYALSEQLAEDKKVKNFFRDFWQHLEQLLR